MVRTRKSKVSSKSKQHTTTRIRSRACFFYLQQLFPSLLRSLKSPDQSRTSIFHARRLCEAMETQSRLKGPAQSPIFYIGNISILKNITVCTYVKKEHAHSHFAQIQTSRQPCHRLSLFQQLIPIRMDLHGAVFGWYRFEQEGKGTDLRHCLIFPIKKL